MTKLNKNDLEKIKTIQIGKWDMISEYTRIEQREKGLSENEAKIRAIAVAIVGYQHRLGIRKKILEERKKEKGLKVKNKWITTNDFDKIINKMGVKYYKQIFSKVMQKMYKRGFSYEQTKQAVNMPIFIGAKVSLESFLPYLNSNILENNLIQKNIFELQQLGKNNFIPQYYRIGRNELIKQLQFQERKTRQLKNIFKNQLILLRKKGDFVLIFDGNDEYHILKKDRAIWSSYDNSLYLSIRKWNKITKEKIIIDDILKGIPIEQEWMKINNYPKFIMQ